MPEKSNATTAGTPARRSSRGSHPAPEPERPAVQQPDAERAAATAVTVNPGANALTLNPSDTFDEGIGVTIPQGQKYRNVRLAASPTVAPFVISIDPPGGYGPVKGQQERTLAFRVRFHGVPCKQEPQVVTGTLDVLADGKVIGKKDVQITVPDCPSELVYAVKFVCGEQAECGCGCAPVQPGRYATEINLHNFGLKEVAVLKRFIPVVLAGAPAGREPRFVGVKAEDRIVLPPQTATMDDCCRIAEIVFGGETPSPVPLTIGFLEISASGPLAVTAVYTSAGLSAGSVNIEVEQITPTRVAAPASGGQVIGRQPADHRVG